MFETFIALDRIRLAMEEKTRCVRPIGSRGGAVVRTGGTELWDVVDAGYDGEASAVSGSGVGVRLRGVKSLGL